MRKAVAALIFFTAVQSFAGSGVVRGAKPVAGRYIVRLIGKHAPGAGLAVSADFQRSHGIKVDRVFQAVYPGFTFEGSDAAATALARDPNVLYVQEVNEFKVTGTQSPAPSWGLDRIDQRDGTSGSYNYDYTGVGTTIYVLDSGLNHVSDLRSQVTPESPNGATDRIVAEYNEINPNNEPYNLTPLGDCSGHGTNVATIAAGRTYGVAKSANIVNVRVADCGGRAFTDWIVKGIDDMVTRHTASAGTEMAVANMSLSGPIDVALDDAVMRAVNATLSDGTAVGITVAVAAGNWDGDSACSHSPGRLGNASASGYTGPNPTGASVITVAASTQADARQTTEGSGHASSTGQCVDIFAPGVDIKSMNKDSAESGFNDTSAATPFVAGVAAIHMERSYSIANSPSSIEGLIKDNGSIDKLANIGAGSPNLLLYSLIPRRRACCAF